MADTTNTTAALVARLFASDDASALTNAAARKIEAQADEIALLMQEREDWRSAYNSRRESFMHAVEMHGIAVADLAVAEAERDAALARVAVLEGAPFPDESGFFWLVSESIIEAQKAMRKFPQPNYVISKFAEESGEVVKAAIHCAEGRETAENVRGEMRQAIAMLYRLWFEGDQVHGLAALKGGA